MSKKIQIYSDGACRGNPGPGGWGILLVYDDTEKEIYGGELETTNNRMELLAVIIGLEALKKEGQHVQVYSDSKYVVDAVEKGWLLGWEKKGFKGKKNPDLWKRFLVILRRHQVKFNWVKGHAGNVYNEKCDQLAVEAAESGDLLIDDGFEAQNNGQQLF